MIQKTAVARHYYFRVFFFFFSNMLLCSHVDKVPLLIKIYNFRLSRNQNIINYIGYVAHLNTWCIPSESLPTGLSGFETVNNYIITCTICFRIQYVFHSDQWSKRLQLRDINFSVLKQHFIIFFEYFVL